MLGFNEEFRNGTSKISKVWIYITLSDNTALEFNEDRVMAGGLVRDTSTTVDNEFTIGAAVTGKLKVVLDNTDDALSGYDFRGATIVAWIGGVLSDETEEKVNIGRYYVDEYSYDGTNLTLVGYDDMVKFDTPVTRNYPTNTTYTLVQLVSRICSDVGVTLYNDTSDFPNRTFTIPYPGDIDWSKLTHHDAISYLAQIACCYAHIVYVPNPGDYRIKFEWYDTSQLTSNQYDGGSFITNTTPYSDGATLDGGSFSTSDTPYSDGDEADAGDWSIDGNRSGVHIIPAPYELSVDTDDVQITGVSVTMEPSDNMNATDSTEDYTKTLGTDGYIIQITGNPFIRNTTYADQACTYLYNCINGMRFRPLTATAVEDPSMEAGDVAIIQGQNYNTYSCFLSRVTYSVGAGTQISCDAQTTMQNLKGRYSEIQKTQALIQRIYSASVSDAEAAMSKIFSSLSTVMGLYNYSTTSSAGTIYLFGNKPTLAASDIRWRFWGGALAVSSDYGQTWNGALSANGIAVLQEVYAIKVNADYIMTGDLTIGGSTKNTDGHLYLNDVNDNTMVTMDANGIYHGKSGINDTTHTGFYLNDDGLIIGDGDAQRYARITPDGTVYVHDNPYYESDEEYITSEPSFIVEGPNGDGVTVRTSITSEQIETTDLYASGNVYLHSSQLHAVGSSAGSDGFINYFSVQDNGVVSNPYLGIKLDIGSVYGVNLWTSDVSLKKEIKDSTENALDAINHIQHRSFAWKKNDKKVLNGYVAQELEKVIPGSTFAVEQGDGTELRQIDSGVVIPYLSKAIQELSAQVDALEARVAELGGR